MPEAKVAPERNYNPKNKKKCVRKYAALREYFDTHVVLLHKIVLNNRINLRLSYALYLYSAQKRAVSKKKKLLSRFKQFMVQYKVAVVDKALFHSQQCQHDIAKHMLQFTV